MLLFYAPGTGAEKKVRVSRSSFKKLEILNKNKEELK